MQGCPCLTLAFFLIASLVLCFHNLGHSYAIIRVPINDGHVRVLCPPGLSSAFSDKVLCTKVTAEILPYGLNVFSNTTILSV